MSILSTLDDFDFKDNQSMLAAFEKDVKHITADVRASSELAPCQTPKVVADPFCYYSSATIPSEGAASNDICVFG
jgi:hypothetical protein